MLKDVLKDWVGKMVWLSAVSINVTGKLRAVQDDHVVLDDVALVRGIVLVRISAIESAYISDDAS
jgi:hypothetical protein